MIARARTLAALLLCASARLAAQQSDPPKSLVARGDSLYHAGTCPACHGSDGSGIVGVAPSLLVRKWLHATGSVASVERVIEVGVEHPKKVSSPMPPNGGMALTEEQRRALAVYLLSLRQTGNKH